MEIEIKTKKYGFIQGVKLTGSLAQKWLEVDKSNRDIRDDLVERYATLMEKDQWMPENGTTIKFDKDGNMLDGQHRCWGVVTVAEKNPKFFITVDVAVGMKPEVVRTINVGAKRTLGDTLTMETKRLGISVKNANVIGASLSIIQSWLNGNIYVKAPWFSNVDVWELYTRLNANGAIERSAHVVCRNGIPISRAIALALHYIWSTNNTVAEKVDAFFESLTTGENLPAGSPILALRRRLSMERPERNLSRTFVIAVTNKAWEYYSKGLTVTKLAYSPESLPPIKVRYQKESSK